MITASSDKTSRLWDTQSGKCLQVRGARLRMEVQTLRGVARWAGVHRAWVHC